MGKSLKGKECGKGISQRKDGYYHARFRDQYGTDHGKYFKSLPEARNWLADAKYAAAHGGLNTHADMTVDEWHKFWVENLCTGLSPNTQRNYKERYERNAKQHIGKMRLQDVKPMHMKLIFNRMEEQDYAGGTIRQAYIALGVMFRAAVDNDIISKHPMDGVRFSVPVRGADDIHFLTVAEQEAFLATARRSHNYRQYLFILETGLRTGELIGLTWDNVDWGQRTITIEKTLEYRHGTHEWRAGPPKTKNSYRTLPLTDTAYDILRECWEERKTRKQSPALDQILTYVNKRNGETRRMVMRDLVFINFRTGEPAKNSSYDTHLYKLCDEAGIERFCMHALRHTYATRAIESGMQPKVLQKLLGHASIKTTMDRYVHVTDDSMQKAVLQFQASRAKKDA